MATLHAHTLGAGPDLVLIHGFGGSGEVWADVQNELAGVARSRAVDLPGHGDSMDYPDAGPPKVAVAAILESLREAGVDRFHLAGHSLGGAVATLIALAAPERVLSLTLLAPGGFGPDINMRLLRRFAAARTADDIAAALEGMVGFRHPVTPEAVASLTRLRARPGQTALLQRFAEGLARDGRQGVIPRERIGALAMPVRILWGMQDNVLPVHSAAGLPGNCRVERLEETGHMLIDEARQAVVDALKAQIATASAAP